ncbi:MAG: pimeloyl-ACP methyl ester esterase BioH [Sideroxydans sp.]|nr:pimeloyl-ACP methyl ester esterase BioH [Sideroxydans sp.]
MHIETIGSGAPLVLIHGWGMHGGVWSEVAQRLAQTHQVHCVDLPGFGLSVGRASARQRFDGLKPDLQMDAIVGELSATFASPVNVCGWSLGGQVAMRWAVREPAKVKSLVLVTTTPCFTERDDWLFGLPAEVLKKFAAELEQNHATTLRRFISLQLRGSENERELLSKLREQLFSRGEPDMDALRGGLEILRDVDQRNEIGQIQQPTLLIAGQRDKLTPPEASYYLAQVIPNAKVVEIEGAAHTPFLSHPELFVAQVRKFLNE